MYLRLVKQNTSGSNYARRMGIHSPPSGHPQNKRWATSARRAGNECPNIETNLGQHWTFSSKKLFHVSENYEPFKQKCLSFR